MNTQTKTYAEKPKFIWAITEGSRALFELASFLPYSVSRYYHKKGDGHPVLIIPGFMATDTSTVPLRSFILKLGYQVYGWGAGRNYASEEYQDLLIQKLDNLYEKHGEKISVIGWSLGGVFARQIAKARPNLVRQVITLGSPFKGVTTSNNAKWMYDFITRDSGGVNPELLEDIPHPAPVPTTAIYSKEDGVVPWQLCMEEVENAIHQNVQVRGSHLGLGVNPSVLNIIADRLLYEEDNWQKFEPNNLMEDWFFYPSL